MPSMNDQHIARLEAQLERLVEGAFTQLFGKTIRPHDIALQLARAMEDGIESARMGDDPRPFAPDQYTIHVNPQVADQITQRQPSLTQILSDHMVELAASAGYRLSSHPLIRIVSDPAMTAGRIAVKARHLRSQRESTALMKRVVTPAVHESPRNPQLLVNGERGISLDQAIINVGRGRDNHIVLDDPTISRHHLQLRLRFGRYTLFDAQSAGGTFVNDVQIKEHRLQSGDVIRIGNTRLIYMEDDSFTDSQTGVISSIDLRPPE